MSTGVGSGLEQALHVRQVDEVEWYFFPFEYFPEVIQIAPRPLQASLSNLATGPQVVLQRVTIYLTNQ